MKHKDCIKCKDRIECEDESDFYHRGCRFKHAFPDCYTKKGGLLFFDMNKVSKKLGIKKKAKGKKEVGK